MDALMAMLMLEQIIFYGMCIVALWIWIHKQ